MFDIGQVCIKVAGRDAGKKCVVVDVIDNNYVLVDGETRRRKVNVSHLEPLKKTLNVQKGADHDTVAGLMQQAGFNPSNTKPKKAADRPKKVKAVKKQEKPKKATKTAAKPKKEAKPTTIDAKAEVKDVKAE